MKKIREAIEQLRKETALMLAEIERLTAELRIKTDAVKEALSISKALWAGVGNHPASRYAKDVEYFEQALKGVD